jgi:hypothetical protein
MDWIWIAIAALAILALWILLPDDKPKPEEAKQKDDDEMGAAEKLEQWADWGGPVATHQDVIFEAPTTGSLIFQKPPLPPPLSLGDTRALGSATQPDSAPIAAPAASKKSRVPSQPKTRVRAKKKGKQ